MTLDELTSLIVDTEHNTAPTQERGIPSIRTPNVGKGRLILQGVRRVSEETYLKWTKRAIPQPGDLIIAREAPVGNVGLILPGQRVCLGQRTVLVRPNPNNTDPAFLCYWMLGHEVQSYFKAVATGATTPHLNMRDIRGLNVTSLPLLPEQKRIAGILSAYDDLIAVNTRRIEALEEMARRTYEEWFGDLAVLNVDNLPTNEKFNHWSMDEICSSVRNSISPKQVSPETPYFGLEHLPRRSLTLTDWGKPSDSISTKLIFEKDDVLFGKIRPYFHKVGHAPFGGICSSDTIVIRAKEEKFMSLVTTIASSDRFVEHATQSSNGTKMPRANWNVLKKFGVPKITFENLSVFETQISSKLEFCAHLSETNQNLRAQRDLLLPRLISGEIDVSDAPLPAAEAAE